jgi:hypothetical protein
MSFESVLNCIKDAGLAHWAGAKQRILDRHENTDAKADYHNWINGVVTPHRMQEVKHWFKSNFLDMIVVFYKIPGGLDFEGCWVQPRGIIKFQVEVTARERRIWSLQENRHSYTLHSIYMYHSVRIRVRIDHPHPHVCLKRRSFGWDRKIRGPVSQQVWRNEDPSLLRGP